MILQIDQWVIRKAIKIAAAGQAVTVNLSAASAGDPAVLEMIEQEIRKCSADPTKLVFEITGTAVMKNIERGRLFTERLVALGCQFALDDFGTGFASLM